MTLINGDRAKDVGSITLGNAAAITAYSVNSNVTTGNVFEVTAIEAGKKTITLQMQDSNGNPLASQTLHQPDGGFGQNDILNFDDLGMTITLGGDDLTVTDKFTVTQGDFVTMQIDPSHKFAERESNDS